MAQEAYDPENRSVSRRTMLRSVGAAVGAAVLAPRLAGAQTPPVGPPSTITQPPRDFSPRGAPTTYFTDPDVLTVEPAFNGLRQPNAPIQRLWTGALWSEGPAWSAQGRYLVWSDIPNNRQLRWIEDDGHVSVFRMPSNNSNGNTFDFQGRQLSCEHVTRRVVRYELDGSVSRHRRDCSTASGSTRPTTSCRIPTAATGSPTRPTAASSTRARWTRRAGPPTPGAGSTRSSGSRSSWASYKRELPTAVYRVDPSGTHRPRWSSEDQVPDPNGLCFSPDYKKLYVISTGKGPGDTDAGGKGDMYVFDVGADNKLTQRQALQRLHGRRREVRAGRRARRRGRQPLGVEQRGARGGLQRGRRCGRREGKLIGRIRLPEVCGNVCFGGPKRNRLFMAASQSLYAVYTATQGAAPG